MNRLIDILSQTFLYVILFYFIACLFLPDVSVYKSVCQIFGINSVWFICYYVVLYICSDGINVALDRFDFRTFTFVVLLLLYISVGKWYARESGMTLFIMVEYYVLARYVRRFGSSYASLLKWAWIPALLMYLAPLCWGYYTGHYIWAFRFLHNYHNPLLFVFAMSIVVAADNWHTNVPAINYVAGSVLAVYMLHENAYAPDLLVTFFGFEHFSPLRSVIVVLAIFAVCVCVDKLRQRLTRKLLDRLNSLFVRAEGQVP